MLTFDRDQSRFNLRVGGIAIHEGCLLTERDTRYDFRVVPGGRCEFHEDTRSTVAREIMEEIGCPARIDRLLWVLENFFHHNGLVYHEIGFFYLVNFPDGSPVLTYKSPFTGAEGNEFLTYEWIALNSLDQCKLYPQFLVHRLVSLPEHTEHVIVNELE